MQRAQRSEMLSPEAVVGFQGFRHKIALFLSKESQFCAKFSGQYTVSTSFRFATYSARSKKTYV